VLDALVLFFYTGVTSASFVHRFQVMVFSPVSVCVSGCMYVCKDVHMYVCGYVYMYVYMYRGADKSLARPGRKQATATEDFDLHIS